MAITRADETELLPALHDGMHEVPRWSTFLDRLKRRTRSEYVSLIFRQGQAPMHQATELYAGRDVRAAARRLGELAALDPIRYDALRPGRVYRPEELIDPQDDDHARFRAYLDRIGVRYGRFMRVAEPGGTSAWAILSRQSEDFGAPDSALLAALAPHLTIALRNFASLERERFRANVAQAALARAGIAWAAYDAQGNVVGANLAGTMSQSPSRGLVDVAAAFAGDPTTIPRALRTDAADLLTVPVPEQPLAAFAMPVMIALTRSPPSLGPVHAALLARLYGLSPKESRLALLLADGRTLAEAAAILRLTIETTRNYSKRLFDKTGTRGQPDLVRLVLGHVTMLA